MDTTNRKTNGRWIIAIPAGYTPDGKKITRYKYSKTIPASIASYVLNSVKPGEAENNVCEQSETT